MTADRIESNASAIAPVKDPHFVTTLITGGTSGIGLELARQAAADGSDLILVARDEAALKAAAEELGRHVRVDTICCDLSKPGAAEDVYRQASARGRFVDTLINCAGFGDYGPFAASDLSKQEQMIAVNVTALTSLTRLFLPAMLESSSGHILNVASVTGFLPGPLMSVYFASKHFVLAFSESLIEELRGTGVKVTVLCPPPVKTGFVQAAQIVSGNYMATTRITPAEVGRYGYRMMKRGKAIAVYSLRYRLLTSVLVRLTPRIGLRRLMHRLNGQGQRLMADNRISATEAPTAAQAWFASGERVGYDAKARAIVATDDPPLRVFLRREGDLAHAVTFLPGYPDGSFSWAKVHPYMPNATEMPKLFVEYVGMGDSDKPKDYAYSTAERTDLVEAIWRELGVVSTTLVAFDIGSLVVLEHLRRRLERSKRGEPADAPEIRGVFIFNGGLFTDGHSHPWFTTPVVHRLPRAMQVALPFPLFKMLTAVLWSKGYHVTDAEVRELYNALALHDGFFFLTRAAGFVEDHIAEGDRLDFGRLFNAYRGQFPFLVGRSEEDPFEHRQIDLAQARLGGLGLQIEHLPGGHLTTHEQPEALAALIAKFERSARR